MYITPRMLPNGSTTDAVTNPGPRSSASWCTVAPSDEQPVERRLDVVDVPVHHRAAGRLAVRGEPAVDDAELVLVVADAELDVGGRPVDLPDEVRLDAEQLGVPVRGGRESSAKKLTVVSPRNIGSLLLS